MRVLKTLQNGKEIVLTVERVLSADGSYMQVRYPDGKLKNEVCIDTCGAIKYRVLADDELIEQPQEIFYPNGRKEKIYPNGKREVYEFQRVKNNLFKNFEWVLIETIEAGAADS